QVVFADFEFGIADTGLPNPVCLVAHELHTGQTIRLWRDEFGLVPPYDTGLDTLFIAYFASAELGCHRVLGWPMPARILDLFTEFRNRFNGLGTIAGNSWPRSPSLGSTVSAPKKSRTCATSSLVVAHGHRRSALRSWITAKAM